MTESSAATPGSVPPQEEGTRGLTYGLDASGHLRHVDEVLNGLRCECRCPGCGARLVAKNQGANMRSHFAHASGEACQGAHESELHMLAKEILAEERELMLPPYGKVYDGGLQSFAEMEVEQRHDCSSLQPDVVGIQHHPVTGKPSRLWIEIMVTHEVDPKKYEKIKQLNISCIQVSLAHLKDLPTSRETIRDFLLHSQQYRQWIHNPTLQQRQELLAEQRRQYAQQAQQIQQSQQIQQALQGQQGRHPAPPQRPNQAHRIPTTAGEQTAIPREKCLTCKLHSTREAILEEMELQRFPAEYRQLMLRFPLNWLETKFIAPLPVRPTDYIVTIGRDTIYLATSSPDAYGRPVSPQKLRQNQRAINFFSLTLPDMAARLGTRCDHIKRYTELGSGKLGVVCGKRPANGNNPT